MIKLKKLGLIFTCPSDRGGKILAFSARVFPVTGKAKGKRPYYYPKLEDLI
jgi:hypothetical protein